MSASTEFSLLLFKSASSHNTNFVISPFSLAAALAIIHDGAKGETQAEITRLLGRTLSPSLVSSLYSSLTADIGRSSVVRTRVANRIFVDKRAAIKSEYRAHIEKKFNASAENIDFSDGYALAKLVSEFVLANTGGMLYKAVDPSRFVGQSCVLINTISFIGEWQSPFQECMTVELVFHGISSDRKIPFLRTNDADFRYSQSQDLTAVSLPYKDPAYSMILLMPTGDFSEWKANLTAEKLEGVRVESGKINLKLPKFKIESKTDGKAALESCGVRRIFGATADISGISDRPLLISAIVQTAVIEVSERGTEAGADTEFLVSLGVIPDLDFNRPFLYVVLKDSHILFIGQHV